MFDFSAIEDGIKVSNQTMIQIFGSMMEDRDRMDTKEWMGRYSGYIMDTAIVVNSMRSKENKVDEDSLVDFAVHIAQMVYTKKYDDAVKDSGIEDLFKAENAGDIARS
tara:strand:+ start:1922 stop:2245 length:324 start_codon:yes stop_codon:yes gene_type:complete